VTLRAPGSFTSGGGRTQRAYDPHGASGIGRFGFVGGLSRNPRGCVVQLLGDVLEPIVRERDAVRSKGIGFDEVGTRRGILPVDLSDDVRSREAEQVVRALQLDRVVLEAVAPEVFLLESVPLDHRAHGAVDDQDALLERFGQKTLSLRPRSRSGFDSDHGSSDEKGPSRQCATGLRWLFSSFADAVTSGGPQYASNRPDLYGFKVARPPGTTNTSRLPRTDSPG